MNYTTDIVWHKHITAWNQNTELALVQCECHTGKETVIARLK